MWEDLGVEFPINNGIHEFEEDEREFLKWQWQNLKWRH
jgi:hypothetical protein